MTDDFRNERDVFESGKLRVKSVGLQCEYYTV